MGRCWGRELVLPKGEGVLARGNYPAVLLRGSSTKITPTPLVRSAWPTARSVSCQRRVDVTPRKRHERTCVHRLLTTRPRTARIGHVRRDGSSRRAAGLRAQRERRHRWYAVRGRPPGACHAKAASTPRNGSGTSERVSIACSPHGLARHVRRDGSSKGVPQCCSEARARRESRRRW